MNTTNFFVCPRCKKVSETACENHYVRHVVNSELQIVRGFVDEYVTYECSYCRFESENPFVVETRFSDDTLYIITDFHYADLLELTRIVTEYLKVNPGKIVINGMQL